MALTTIVEEFPKVTQAKSKSGFDDDDSQEDVEETDHE